jgi:hypothetical protein
LVGFILKGGSKFCYIFLYVVYLSFFP